MSKKERPLQLDMFTGELVDNRTRQQKKRDKEREAPQQMLMFSQREIAQFGVNPHPKISLSPHTSLRLIRPDYRSPTQIEADRERQALKLNHKLFTEETPATPDQQPDPLPASPYPLLPPPASYEAPQLPPPRQSFEQAFAPHETHFYQHIQEKYPEDRQADMAQEVLLALWQAWLKNPDLLNKETCEVVSTSLLTVQDEEVSQNHEVQPMSEAIVHQPPDHETRWTRLIEKRLDLSQAILRVFQEIMTHMRYERLRVVLLWWLADIPGKEIAHATGFSETTISRDKKYLKQLFAQALV
jgi:DNA-directed RNA polymerase specialized sigma24 family protein